MVVTVHTDHFLSHIGVGLHILTVSRDLQSQLVAVYYRSKLQAGQDANHILGGNGNTQNTIYLVDAYFHLTRLYGIAGIYITVSLTYLTAAQLFHQMQRSLQSHDGSVLVYALGVTGTGVRDQTQGTGSLSYVVTGKLGTLKHYLGGSVADLRIETTHNTSQSYRLYAVADHQVVGLQSVFLFIQSHYLLAFGGTSYVDGIALQVSVVKGVHGLTQLLQYVVGDIYHVGDGIDANQSQTALHPGGRFFDLYIIYIVSHVARAQFGSVHGNGEAFLLYLMLGVIQSRHLALLAQDSSYFSSDTVDALAVGTVSGDGNVKHPVIQTQDGLYIGTDLSVLRQYQQAVVTGTGIHIFGNTQLYAGAQHTVGLIATQLALLDLHHAFYGLVILGSHVNAGTN